MFGFIDVRSWMSGSRCLDLDFWSWSLNLDFWSWISEVGSGNQDILISLWTSGSRSNDLAIWIFMSGSGCGLRMPEYLDAEFKLSTRPSAPHFRFGTIRARLERHVEDHKVRLLSPKLGLVQAEAHFFTLEAGELSGAQASGRTPSPSRSHFPPIPPHSIDSGRYGRLSACISSTDSKQLQAGNNITLAANQMMARALLIFGARWCCSVGTVKSTGNTSLPHRSF